MYCTNCGEKLEDGAKFCTSCGAKIEAAPEASASVAKSHVLQDEASSAPVAEETATEETVQTAEEAPKENKDTVGELLGKAKALWAAMVAKVSPLLKKADGKVGEILGDKKIYAYAGVIALLGIIIVVSAIAGLIPESNGYLKYDYAEAVNFDDQLYVIKNGKFVTIEGSAENIRESHSSIDGKVVVFDTSDDELYLIKGKKAVLIAEDVDDYKLSIYGDSVVYTSVDELVTTYYYCKLGKEPVEIFENEIDSIVTSYAVSPDGKCVVYTATDGLDSELYFFNGKESEKIGKCNGTVISISNGAKYIYASVIGEDLSSALYCFNKKGEKEKIDSFSSKSFATNLDGTEFMFYDDNRTYISVKGKDPVKAASANLRLLRPEGTASRTHNGCTVYPVDSLYNHVYTGGNSLYFVSKRESKNIKLTNTDGDIFLDSSAEYVYYMDDEELKCLKVSHGSGAKDKAKVIAEDVESYVVTSGRKYVYFVSDDSVCVVNGKKGGKPKTLSADDVQSGIVISVDDIVYYMSDDALYGIKGRSKGKKIMDDASPAEMGGYVYILDEDAIYAARGTGKPKKLLDID